MNLTNLIMITGATVTATSVIVIGFIKISEVIKRTIHFFDDYFGEEERAGFPGRPGLQERLRCMEEELKTISYEMKPNSGSSIKDAINRIEKRLDALENK